MGQFNIVSCLFGFFVLTLLRSTTTAAPYTTTEATQKCVGKPADIVFVLDSSSSIYPRDFRKQLKFVQSVVNIFPIAADKMRVGVLSYSNDPQPQFGLKDFNDKDDMKGAIRLIRQSGGDTATDKAIDFMRETYFAETRKDVPKIGIVITDGESDKPEMTAEAAKRAHEAGIHIFAIGVGKSVNEAELVAIATSPKEQNVYMVDRFAELEKKVKESLAIRACEVKSPVNDDNQVAFIPPPISAHQPPPSRTWRKKRPPTVVTIEEACQKSPADLVFVLDSSTSIWGPDYRRMKKFLQSMIDIFHISMNLTQVGVITFSDDVKNQFDLNKFHDKDDMLDRVRYIRQIYGGTNTAKAITFMRTHSFAKENGRRDDVPHIGVVLTDGKSWDKPRTIKESALAHEAGIHMISIGIGEFVDQEEVDLIATPSASEADKNSFHLENFKALDKAFREKLAIKTCLIQEILSPAQEYFACAERSPTDVMFALDPTYAGAKDHQKSLQFIKELVTEMEVSPETVEVGMIPMQCSSMTGFHFGTYENSDALIGDIDQFSYPDTTQLLNQLWSNSFAPGNGARSDSRKMAVLIMNSKSDDLVKLLHQKQKLQLHKIEMYVIGVGANVDEKEMNMIASSPRHVRMLDTYDELPTLKEHVLNDICGEIDFDFSDNEVTV